MTKEEWYQQLFERLENSKCRSRFHLTRADIDYIQAKGLDKAEELDQKLAQRIRNIRKRRSIFQEKLSLMSGVSYGSIKRFEATGQISLISLTKIAMALNIADELRSIFTQVPYRNVQEVINETK